MIVYMYNDSIMSPHQIMGSNRLKVSIFEKSAHRAQHHSQSITLLLPTG